MESGKNYVLGIYNDEDILLKAVKTVRESGVKIEEVFTPYPIHGLEHALGYKRSKLPVAAFLFGLLGTTLALTMQFFMMKIDWPMIIGGKDFAPLPTFIPVTFELTVLLASFGMVGTFFVISNLKPWARPKVFDLRSTDDKMVMAIDLASNNTMDIARIKDVLTGSGAAEANEKSF
ncbi:MAG: DUF3341 domain-containing protein [Cyclobacteriaceae bacterium]